MTLITNNTVENQLQKFWEIEEYKSKSNWSRQEDLCETHFLSNYKRDYQGRFIVKLPFVKENNELGSSKEIAINRLHSLEHKFKNQPLLKLEYSKFMNDSSGSSRSKPGRHQQFFWSVTWSVFSRYFFFF
jgi:hypothetical protein